MSFFRPCPLVISSYTTPRDALFTLLPLLFSSYSFFLDVVVAVVDFVWSVFPLPTHSPRSFFDHYIWGRKKEERREED